MLNEEIGRTGNTDEKVENDHKLEKEYVEVELLSKKEGEEPKRCIFIGKNNKQCKGFAIKDSLFCFTHCPQRRVERGLARSKGGDSKAFLARLAPFKIDEAKDIATTIAKIINEVRQGSLPAQQANSMFYGINILLKAYELTVLAKRVEALKKAYEEGKVNRLND